jgi:hypothetical protein
MTELITLRSQGGESAKGNRLRRTAEPGAAMPS